MLKDKRFERFNASFDVARSEKYQPSPVASVRFARLPNGGIKYQSDVYLIMNQKRILQTLGSPTLKAWLDGFDDRNTGVDMSKFTDDQILAFVKSRYIQSPSELRAWSDYLNDNAQQIIDELNATVEQQKELQRKLAEAAAQQQQQQQQQETAASGD